MSKALVKRQFIDGIIQVTGPPGVGKTSFALATPVTSPQDIAVFNFDHKPYFDRSSNDDSGPFGYYRSYLHMLKDAKQNKDDPTPELRMVEQVMRDLEKAKGAEVVIFDAWEIFSKGLVPFFVRNAASYKDFIGGGTILQMSKLGHASVVESAILDSVYSELGARTIFVINHLMHEYDGFGEKAVRTGRKIPRSNDRLHEKARARFWLKPNPDPEYDCPIAVVMKDAGVRVWDQETGGFRAMRMLPYRLNPSVLNRPEENVSLWDIIAHYQNNPVGDRPQTELELPTEEEFAMIAGTLTVTEQRVWEANKEMAKSLGGEFSTKLGDLIIESKEQGLPFGRAYQNAKELGYNGTLMEFKKAYEG